MTYSMDSINAALAKASIARRASHLDTMSGLEVAFPVSGKFRLAGWWEGVFYDLLVDDMGMLVTVVSAIIGYSEFKEFVVTINKISSRE